MYPAPEGRQVKVQPQQDTLYGERGEICLPRLRRHIVPHALYRTPPRNDCQQYRGKAQQCQNHSLRVCDFGFKSLRCFLQALPNVGFCFLRRGRMPSCLYPATASLLFVMKRFNTGPPAIRQYPSLKGRSKIDPLKSKQPPPVLSPNEPLQEKGASSMCCFST